MIEKGSIEANKAFYKGKRVFVTGHNGFTGTWLVAALHELGAEVMGYAMPASPSSAFAGIKGGELIQTVDGSVLDYEQLRQAMLEFQPEIVMHLAAIAIVKDCFDAPRKAFEINVMGTVNTLEAVRCCPSVKSVIVVTTDKVYENKGDGAVYAEGDPLGGADPYSSSKSCMELVTDCYKRSVLQTKERTVSVATARTANAIGGGDNHTDSRLVPQLLAGFTKGETVQLRNPYQTRPWQDVIDAVNAYLTLARYMDGDPLGYSGCWNIGPSLDGIKEVKWVVEKLQSYFEGSAVAEGEKFAVKESATLGINISKLLDATDWQPERSTDETLYYVVDYYKRQLSGENEREILFDQIRKFYKK